MTDGEDRERLSSARRAAEALFAPKPQPLTPPGAGPGHPAEAYNPRVLPALPPAPIRQEKLDAAPASAALEIPASKRAYVRALVKYGMTIGQVAEVYGVPLETVARLIRKS